MADIFIIDDDLATEVLMDNLRYRGHDVVRIASTSEALEKINEVLSAHLVILDIIMPWPSTIEKTQTRGDLTAGMEVYREIRRRNSETPVLVYSATQDVGIIDTLEEDPCTTFIPKWSTPSMKDLVSRIHDCLGIDRSAPAKFVPFIVHGHDDVAKLSLKNYLQNTLKLPEPIILHEQPNQGRTLIEKFEGYAQRSFIVFVLLTRDDLGAKADDTDELKRRARQNVIFEMGYFLGMLGRKSGRVILLHDGPMELPSDLSGVIYIDIKNGIEAAGELIRREIQHVL